MDSEIERLWQDVYEIQSCADMPIPAQIRLREMCRGLRDRTSCVAEADRHLLLGYLAYHFGDLTGMPLDCEKELQTALRLAPDNLTAALYLGHFYFDRGDFARAKDHLSSIDPTRYSAAGQEWRAIKIREILLVCDLQLGLFDDILGSASVLLADMLKVRSEDCPIPVELVNALLAKGRVLEAAIGACSFKMLTQKVILVTERHQMAVDALDRFRRESQRGRS